MIIYWTPQLVVSYIRGALAEGYPAEAADAFRRAGSGNTDPVYQAVMDGLNNDELDVLIAWSQAFADGATSTSIH